MKPYFLILLTLLLAGCNHALKLKLYTPDDKTEIDTIESYPEKGLYFVNIIHYGFLGHFSMNYAVITTDGPAGKLIYSMDETRNLNGRVSKYLVAFVKDAEGVNWGWFCINNGKIMSAIPGMNKLIDSLKSANTKDFFIRENNGYIMFYKEGKVMKRLNYGQFVTKDLNTDFDALKHSLYQLDGDSLKMLSNNADDLFKQTSGIFFIPPPGYGVIDMFNKQDILHKVDSVSKLKNGPSMIEVLPLQN